MSSGSLKDLTKAVSSSIVNPTLPLPEDLLQVLHAYLEKHETHDDSDTQRLQEELLAIYQKDVLGRGESLAPFLAILQTLKPAIRGSGRLLQWWDKLSDPVLNQLGEQKGLATEARNTLLGILVYDEDDEDIDDRASTSDAVSQNLLSTWLVKARAASTDFDEEAQFVEGQLQLILLTFGKKQPKRFLTSMNSFFVNKDTRILMLSLLCEFIRQQPPHLHQLLQTPLFDSLLKCLQVDTSTRVISLAMTALIMFLPHVPSSLSTHLPALFNIYSRMLFWDRERRSPSEPSVGDEDDEKNEKSSQVSDGQKSWAKLSYLLESDDDTVPELLHYFTFMYGLYPINFMSYIRKPQRYLRHAKYPGADELEIQPIEIRQRSEPFRQVHLLHPNFFMMTLESELTDNNRWIKSEAADVVAECMALYTAGEGGSNADLRARSTYRGSGPRHESNADVPEQPLLDQENIFTPIQPRYAGWRSTQSSAIASGDGYRGYGGQHRKTSQTSQSMPSIADSPTLRPDESLDSPTLPPHIIPSLYNLHDMLNAQKSGRDRSYLALTNDSVQSLSLSNNNHDSPANVDAYLHTITREPMARSPSLRPSGGDAASKIAYLQREITLLRNDLKFEVYLKQQHLLHIGQLRRKQIREARVEAEMQNLINSNRTLKKKLEDAKTSSMRMKKESEKSKSHSRKWEADLTAKLRTLREEQKKWLSEGEDLRRDLETARDDALKLRQIVLVAEVKELGSKQKMQNIETNLDELESLRAEVEKLTISLRTYEAGEDLVLQAQENETALMKQVEILKMKLAARDQELAKSKRAFEEESQALRDMIEEEGFENGRRRVRGMTQDMLDSTLAVGRNRIIEVQKAHNHLLKRYTALQTAYMDLRDQQQSLDNDWGDEPLLGGTSRPAPSHSESYKTNSESYKTSSGSPEESGTSVGRPHANSDPDLFDWTTYNATGGVGPSSFPVRPIKLDASQRAQTATGLETRPMFQPILPPVVSQIQSSSQLSSTGTGKASADGDSHHHESLDGHGKPKIKPQSDVRVYGRGGVQNIGKKEKDKDKEKKDKEKEGQESKKDKKNTGIRGIRGFNL